MDADLVVTVSHREGIGFYLPDERRWVVSFPQQHHTRGLKKEKVHEHAVQEDDPRVQGGPEPAW